MESKWRVWKTTRGKVKGLAIIFPASDIGLELVLHSDLIDEDDREQVCQELCDALNAQRKINAR